MKYSDLKPKVRARILMESLSSERTFKELFKVNWIEKYRPPFEEDVDFESMELPYNFPIDLAKHLEKYSNLI